MRKSLCVLLLILAGCRTADSGKSFSFTPATGRAFTDFAVCDIDKDGLAEIATAEWSKTNKTGAVSIYTKNGGNYEKRFSFDCSAKPLALSFGDFDSDGIADIAYIEYPWFFNLRTGSNRFEKLFRDMNQNQWAQSLAYGKLTGKGKADFLCGPVWRRWNNDNSFSCGYFSSDMKGVFNGNSIITDTDSDGNQDVVFYNDCIRILYGPLPDIPNMKMKNSMARYYVEIPSPFEIKSMSFEDVDGDGITDIAAIGEKGGLIVFRQHLHGFDQAEKPLRILPDAVAFCFGKDHLIYSDGRQIWRVARRDIFSKNPEKYLVASLENVTEITIANIDGDGFPELLLLSPSKIAFVRPGQTL